MSFPRLLCALSATTLLSSAVEAITLEDYVDPNSAYEDAYANIDFDMDNKNSNTNTYLQTQDEEGLTATAPTFQTSYNLEMKARYRKVFSSLPLAWNYSAEISGRMSQQGSYTEASEKSGTSSEDMTMIISGVYDRYLDTNPNVFWFGEGDFSYYTEQDHPKSEVDFGVGYGRVITATPLARALRVMEDFQRFGLLTAYPSDVVMIEVAQIINKREEFESKYGPDEYRRAWYEAIETVLLGGGLINGDGLGALGVIKLDDVLTQENIETREHGWFARGAFSYVIQDFDGDRGDKGLKLSFKYAKPYGYKGQLIEDVSVVRALDSEGGTSVDNELSYTYEVSDLVDWKNTWTVSRFKASTGNYETSNSLVSKFSYEVSNVFKFNVGIDLEDSGDDYVQGVRGRVTTGVEYRLR